MTARVWAILVGSAALLGEAVAIWGPVWATAVLASAATVLIVGSLVRVLLRAMDTPVAQFADRRAFDQTLFDALPWRTNQPRLAALYSVAVSLASELSTLMPAEKELATQADQVRAASEHAGQQLDRVSPDVIRTVQQITENARSRFPLTVPEPTRPSERLLGDAVDQLGAVVQQLRSRSQTTS